MTKRTEILGIVDTIEGIVERIDTLIENETDEKKIKELNKSKGMHIKDIERLLSEIGEKRTKREFLTQEELEDIFINEGYSIEKAVVLSFHRMVELITIDGWKVDYSSHTQTIYKDIII